MQTHVNLKKELAARRIVPVPAPTQLSREERIALGRRLMFEHPELRALGVEVQRGEVQRAYRQFLQARGRSPEEIKQFEDLMLEKSERNAMTAVGFLGLPLTTQNIPPDQLKQQIDNQLRDLLGADGYRQMVEFGRNQFNRDMVGRMAATLYDSPTPLTAEQANRLTEILASHGGRWFLTLDWDAVMESAKPLLSGPQLDALETMKRLSTVGHVK